MGIFRFEHPAHYMVEDPQYDSKGQLLSRIETLVMVYEDALGPVYFCTRCYARSCPHIQRVAVQALAEAAGGE